PWGTEITAKTLLFARTGKQNAHPHISHKHDDSHDAGKNLWRRFKNTVQSSLVSPTPDPRAGEGGQPSPYFARHHFRREQRKQPYGKRPAQYDTDHTRKEQ